MRKRVLVWSLSALLTLGVTAACGGSSSPTQSATNNFPLISSGTLTVATWGTSPPEIVVNGDQLTGLDGALLNAFASDHKLTLKVFSTDFASSILAVQQRKADMGAYFYWSPARSQQMFYTKPIFADTTVVIYKDTFTYTGPDSLKGKKIGATTGSVYTPIVQKLFGNNVVVFPGITQMSTALINGQVDALVEANTVATEPPLAGRTDIKQTQVNPGDFGMTADQLTHIAYNVVPCGSGKLADALDAELAKLQSSGAWTKALSDNSAQPVTFANDRPTQGCSG